MLVVMLLVSMHAFSFAHIRLSCRKGKQPSCMQYKEEGTRRWSKNSAQQEQMCPLKTGWGNSNCRQCTYIELFHACLWMNNWWTTSSAMQNTFRTYQACMVRALIKLLLALLDSSIWSDFFIPLSAMSNYVPQIFSPMWSISTCVLYCICVYLM